jgi:hypothetical protein
MGKQEGRIPRGNVVGAEGAAGNRAPAGRIGQRGVVGSANQAKNVRPTRQGTGGVEANGDGVTGKAVGKATPVQGKGTPGASAAGRGMPGSKGKQRKSRRDRSEENRDSRGRRSTERTAAEDHERGSEEA